MEIADKKPTIKARPKEDTMRKAFLCMTLALAATLTVILGNSPPMAAPTPIEQTILVGNPTTLEKIYDFSAFAIPQQQQPSAQAVMPMFAAVILLLGAASMLPKIVVITKALRRFWRGLPSLAKHERSFVLG